MASVKIRDSTQSSMLTDAALRVVPRRSGSLDEGISYFIQVIDEADGSIDTYSRQTSSGGSAGGAGPTAIHVRIVGNVSPGSNGNLTIQFAQNAASGTSTVKKLGSLLMVTPILD
jgi:hypothetical protein